MRAKRAALEEALVGVIKPHQRFLLTELLRQLDSLSGKTRKGSPWLRKTLVEVANAAARPTTTYLSAQYHRLAARRGRKRALVAVGHTLLVIIHRLLSQHQSDEELGSNYFDERNRQQTEKRLVRRLEKLGYQVELQPNSPAA